MKTINKVKKIRRKLKRQYNRLKFHVLNPETDCYCDSDLCSAYRRLGGAIGDIDHFITRKQLKPIP